MKFHDANYLLGKLETLATTMLDIASLMKGEGDNDLVELILNGKEGDFPFNKDLMEKALEVHEWVWAARGRILSLSVGCPKE